MHNNIYEFIKKVYERLFDYYLCLLMALEHVTFLVNVLENSSEN
jgi:hypothetical protein